MEPSVSLDERLKSAAESGEIDMLYTLIREDPYVLDRIEHIPFVDTPLHIAASVGHIGFAMETMLLKPSFARKLNQDGFAPLHLALLRGQTKMVDRLLDADSALVRVQVESKKFDAFCLLVERLQTATHKGSQNQEYKTLNWKNILGDTVLHIAVKTHQPKVVRVLIDSQVKLNVKNADGLTALEILESGDSEVNNCEARKAIKEMLRRAEAYKSSSFFGWKSSKSSSPPDISSTSLRKSTADLHKIEGASNASPPLTSSTLSIVNHELDIALGGQPKGNIIQINSLPHTLFLKVKYLLERWIIDLIRGRNNLSEDSRNMLLVALVLIATVGYQGVLSPPGGVRQDDNNFSTNHENKTSSQIHPPGTVIMGHWNFLFFMMFNSLALAITAHAILFLVLPDQGEPRWWSYPRNLLAAFTSLCYLISLLTISPNVSLFMIIFVIAAIVFLIIPVAYVWIKGNLVYKTQKWRSLYATHGLAT